MLEIVLKSGEGNKVHHAVGPDLSKFPHLIKKMLGGGLFIIGQDSEPTLDNFMPLGKCTLL